jgi:hypothetical protein
MDHLDTRREQYPYQDLGFMKERWPATGQGKEEEGDYEFMVHNQCIIFNLEHLKKILRSISKLVYF